jgi:hypothetical protein
MLTADLSMEFRQIADLYRKTFNVIFVHCDQMVDCLLFEHFLHILWRRIRVVSAWKPGTTGDTSPWWRR